MFGSLTVRRACIFSAKGIAWVLYAGFLEYCVRSVMMYFLPELKDEDEDEGDTVFFTEKDNNCWKHITSRNPCGKNCSYTKIRKILGYMDQAKYSLDISIYHLTQCDFAFSIIDAHKRGVNVRVVADGYRVAGTGSQIAYLAERGIPVRLIAQGHDMHHKFFIVDSMTLVNCSFNWTMQAVAGNSEDAVILNETVIVKNFLGHFDMLWNVAKPWKNRRKKFMYKTQLIV